MEGIQFVLQYYFIGCPSWSWYYPNYYSPLISDLFKYLVHCLKTEKLLDKTFAKGDPYPPFKQLLCILHPDNVALLPKPFQYIFTDENSPLKKPFDYFPKYIKIDPFGAIFSHQFTVILPFITEEIVTNTYQVDLSLLSPEES